MGTPVTIQSLSKNGATNNNELILDISELDVLVQVIKNTEDGFTYINPPKQSAEYKGIIVFCGKWVWDARTENFVKGNEPSLWLRIQLRVVLFFNL